MPEQGFYGGPSGDYVGSAMSWGGVNATITPASDTSGPGVGWNVSRDALGEALGFYFYDRGTRKWAFGFDSVTDDYVMLTDDVAGRDLIRVASSTRTGYDGANFVMGAGVATPSANTRLEVRSEKTDAFLANTFQITNQRDSTGASSTFAGSAGVPSGSALLIADTNTTRAQITPRGWAAFGGAYVGRSNVGGIEVSRCVTINTSAPPVWTANTRYVVGEVYQNAGTYYRVLTQYVSGATFGATDTTNNSAVSNPNPTLSLVDFASGTHTWNVYNDLANSYEFVISNGTRIVRINGSAAVQNIIFVGSDSSLLLATAATKLGFYGHATIAQQVLATGASHTVDDVITALQAVGLVKQA